MENTEHDYYKRHGRWLTLICLALIGLFIYEFVVTKWVGFIIISIVVGIMTIANVVLLILEKLGKLE